MVSSTAFHTQNVLVANVCFVKTGKFLCSLCHSLVDESSSENHFEACFKTYINDNASECVTAENFCTLTRHGPLRWQKTQFYLCPFKTCIDDRMRKLDFGIDTVYLKNIAVRLTKNKYSVFKRGKFAFYDRLHVFHWHCSQHLFWENFDSNRRCEPLWRYPTKSDSIECSIYNCHKQFPNSADGINERLTHINNDHRLFLLKDPKDQIVPQLTVERLSNSVVLPDATNIKEDYSHIDAEILRYPVKNHKYKSQKDKQRKRKKMDDLFS